MTSVVLVRETTGSRIIVYGLAIFLSAFLIFTVQPIFTKVVLPILGGTPAIWSVAMVVFQGLLLAGYLYAHLLIRFLPLKAAICVHIALTCLAFSVLPFSVSPGWGDPPPYGESMWLIGTFIQAIGLPFFALSANAPLLQAWLAAQDRTTNVYHFYAASNIGSFAALFAYPLVIEPSLNLYQQSHTWLLVFGSFLCLLIACGALAWRGHIPERDRGHARPVQWSRRLGWVILAALPSGLLIAATATIQTDVSGGPILWLLPLAIFLLSFVFAFRDSDHQGDLWVRAVRASSVLVLVSTVLGSHNFLIVLCTALFAVLSVSMACHGGLYRSRPDSGRLTEFYLCISCGGLIGGLFAALLAPKLFSWMTEYPLLMCAAVLILSFDRERDRGDARSFAWGAGLVAAIASMICILKQDGRSALDGVLIMTVLMLFGLMAPTVRPAVRGSLVATLVALMVLPYGSDVQRSFFGVHRVMIDPSGQYRKLMHGSTMHGAQRLTDEGRPEPLTYYGIDGPISRALNAARRAKEGVASAIGIVGLGTGSMACHQQRGEHWIYFEIDPVIVAMARDPQRFRFLSECGQDVPIVMGDARLTVHKQPAHSFDYLLIDAFSSDAIPVHLVTQEAIDMFLSRISYDRILAIHISNRYINLAPVLSKIAEVKGLDVYLLEIDEPEERKALFYASAGVAAFATGPEAAAALQANGFKKLALFPDQALWTDHYANITIAIIRSQLRKWFSS